MSRLIDLTGQRFGMLTVLGPRRSELEKSGTTVYWLCKCDCGASSWVAARHLRNGHTQSCGCFRSIKTTAEKTKHGKRWTKEYIIWAGMIQRCQNPNHQSYALYGGRGISVCDRWLGEGGFENFLDDMGPAPSAAHQIDRFPNNDGDYEKSNCRWATIKQQARNRRPWGTSRLQRRPCDTLRACSTPPPRRT